MSNEVIEHVRVGDTHFRKWGLFVAAFTSGASVVGGIDFRLYTGSWGSTGGAGWVLVASAITFLLAAALAIVPEVKQA